MNPLFTVGHSTHEFAYFLELLERNEITAIADVRSHPSSRLPWFSRDALAERLKSAGIRYVFLGVELGARRVERECYIGPRADYGLISQTTAFQKGLERLRRGVENYRIAMMCSEREPLDCHRTILVSRQAKDFADVYHIKANGGLESHADAESRLVQRYFSTGDDLFRSTTEQLVESYHRRGLEINYVDPGSKSPVVREDSIENEY